MPLNTPTIGPHVNFFVMGDNAKTSICHKNLDLQNLQTSKPCFYVDCRREYKIWVGEKIIIV